MANPVNQQKMIEVENRDFQLAKAVLEQAFKYTTIDFQQSPPLSVYDATLEVDGKKYIVEIKSRDQSVKYGTFPILESKYNNLIAAAERQQCGCVYIVLNSNGYAYIYDLCAVSLDDCVVRPWHIRRWELSEDNTMAPQMTIFLPIRWASLYRIHALAREHN